MSCQSKTERKMIIIPLKSLLVIKCITLEEMNHELPRILYVHSKVQSSKMRKNVPR